VALQSDVRRIALSLPGVEEEPDHFGFFVPDRGKKKRFAWVWSERVDPKKARVPRPGVLAVRVAGTAEKEMLLAADPEKFFTEAHYNGFPAVLVRLEAVDLAELEELITDAWMCQAPRTLVEDRAPSHPDTPRP
jgi:hypothetical protein